MLNASAAKIYLCLDPTDMRKSFDTLPLVPAGNPGLYRMCGSCQRRQSQGRFFPPATDYWMRTLVRQFVLRLPR